MDTNSMLSLVYLDRQHSDMRGEDIPQEFWEAMTQLVLEGRIIAVYDDDSGSVMYQKLQEVAR